MQTAAPHPSVAAIGPEVGSLVERHIDRTFRRINSPHAERDPRFLRVITGAAHPFGNFALISNPADADAASAAVEPLTGCGAPAAVLFIGAVASGVDAVLREHGFAAHGLMSAMAVDIERLAPAPAPEGCALVRFPAGARDDEWIDAFAAGYELPRAAAAVFSPATLDAGGDEAPVQFFGVTIGGVIAATAALVLDDGVAGIYCVATLPERRGRGLGAFATAEPLRIAHRLGYRVGVLQSSEAGHNVYKRLGFTDCGGVPLYVRMPT